MDRRLELHDILLGIADHAYFQPPETVKMKYPCIVYHHSANDTSFADNRPYQVVKRYTAIVIDRDPDSDIPDRMAQLPMCSLERTYTMSNLNHWVFNIYY